MTEDYSKMGVTPEELYMRQQGACYLLPVITTAGEIQLYCTDGEERARADALLNPTPECARCMVRYITTLTQGIIDGKEIEFKDSTPGAVT